MKISNSKKELARIISDNGGWRSGDYASQHGGHGGIGFSLTKPERWGDTGWDAGGSFVSKIEYKKPIKNWHQTILSREEYLHLYPAPDADGWIEWDGGECPVCRGELVDVKYSSGITNIGVSALTDKTSDNHVSGSVESLLAVNWDAGLPMSGIIAYRLHNPEQFKPEFCESVMRSIPEPESKPTIEQLAADYRNLLDFAQRKQQEADDAKADADARLKALELAAKAVGLLVSPITAKQESELVITDWRDLQVWDEISVQHMKNVYSKSEVLVVGDSEVAVRNHVGTRKTVNLDAVDWKFIRRP